jgi:Cu/Ag efflux protein CusF
MRRLTTSLLIIWLLLPSLTAAATISPFSQGYIEGYLQNITLQSGDENTPSAYVAQIESYAGGIFKLRINPQAALTIDQIPVKTDAFRAGMEVYGQLRGQSLMSLESYSTAQLGYIEPGTRVRSGIVRKIERDQLQIELLTGETITCFTSPATLIKRMQQTVSINNLYEGDRVKAYFDEVNSNQISRLLVMGDAVVIKDILRGTLQSVDSSGKKLTLRDVSVLRNTQWNTRQPTLKIELPHDVPIYLQGQLIPAHQLKNYCKYDVYLAIRQVMGKDIVEKIVLKAQQEYYYQEQIAKINWYTEALELDNQQNLSFNDGTIIVKNDRLLDKYALQQGDDALVLADGRLGSGTATLINIINQSLNNSAFGQYYIYAGYLDQLMETNLWLNDFYILSEQEWEYYDDEKKLYYSRDTSIYDAVGKKYLTPEQFLAGKYVTGNPRDNWFTYILTDGDEILSMVVQKTSDSLLKQRVSAGTINTVDYHSSLGWTVSLYNVRDWSIANNRWMPRGAGININLSRCMIVKNGKTIPPEELHSGEQLYIVRDDYFGKIIMVK